MGVCNRGLNGCSILLSVDVAPIPCSDDTDDESVVFDLVQYSVVPLSEAVAVLSGQLLGARWARVVRQGLDGCHNALGILLGDAPHVL